MFLGSFVSRTNAETTKPANRQLSVLQLRVTLKTFRAFSVPPLHSTSLFFCGHDCHVHGSLTSCNLFQKTDLGHGSFVRLGSIKSTRQVTMLMCPEKDGKWRTYLVRHLVFWILHCRHCQQPAVRSSRPLPGKNGRQLLRHLVRFTFVMNRLGYLGPVAPTGMRPDILPKQIHFIRSRFGVGLHFDSIYTIPCAWKPGAASESSTDACSTSNFARASITEETVNVGVSDELKKS